MQQLPYLIQVQQAIARGDAALMQNTVQHAMQEIGDKLQTFLPGCYTMDLPFVIAALEMVAESIRGTMDSADQRLADDLKHLVTCATIGLNYSELQRQVQETDEVE